MVAVILKYKVDNNNQYRVRGINYSGNGRVHTLGVKDEYMYISVPEETLDSYIPQPDEVDISVVTMTPIVSADIVSWAMPCKQIDKRTRRAIREEYTIDAEFKALRTDDTQYHEFVEDLVAKGKIEKVKILGLSEISGDDS